jgi:hypothetical protein
MKVNDENSRIRIRIRIQHKIVMDQQHWFLHTFDSIAALTELCLSVQCKSI